MEKISFHIQTSKDGTVKVRFRLRDGRDVQLLHKSGIRCKIPDLAKLNPDGSTKDKVHVYNADLSALLKEEHRLMTTAYGLMKGHIGVGHGVHSDGVIVGMYGHREVRGGAQPRHQRGVTHQFIDFPVILLHRLVG